MANHVEIALWTDKNLSKEAWSYLACDQQIFADSFYRAAFDDLFKKLYVEEEICYLSATDAYAAIDLSESGCPVSLSNYENTLISFAVDREWAVFTQKEEGFVWVIVGEDLTLKQVNQATMQELIAYREQEELELISVSTFKNEQDE